MSEEYTMLSCHFMGGLGNQMFQAAATMGIGKDVDKQVIFPHVTDQQQSRTVSYNTSYFHKLPFEGSNELKTYKIIPEHGFSYTNLDDKIKTIAKGKPKMKMALRGYFQSWKYFDAHRDLILNTFMIPTNFKNTVKKNYKELLEHPSSVSIHIRRGDYLKHPEFHVVLPMDYYEQAVKKFNKKSVFVVFSDDIEWCKEQEFFKTLGNVVFVKDMDYNEMYLMSLCKHNIIANSSFSWWGAYLNMNRRKKVIAPMQWFGPKGPKDLQDLRPDSWITM
jgi:hypothetical protein